jgi:signal transduction histidine kinase
LRDALARDLHDGVAQFLAGTLFRLEALSRWIREGQDPTAEINDLKSALRRGQGRAARNDPAVAARRGR